MSSVYDMARNDFRQPEYHRRVISDDFFGFMLAGHDTSATTVAWGLKYLTDNPDVQTRLREDLRVSNLTALEENRAPTAHELASTQIPSLEAVVEEVLRQPTRLHL